MPTKFGVDILYRFLSRVQTHRQTQTHVHTVTDATDHPTQASATVDIGNNRICLHFTKSCLIFISIIAMQKLATEWTSASECVHSTCDQNKR